MKILNCSEENLATQSIDVSREGMGILTESHLLAGDIVELTVGDKTISLEVVYCLMDLIHRGKFRSGLRRVKSSENLLDVFKKHGCL